MLPGKDNTENNPDKFSAVRIYCINPVLLSQGDVTKHIQIFLLLIRSDEMKDRIEYKEKHYSKLTQGDLLEVGDLILTESYNKITDASFITRIASKLAFIRVNDTYQRKFIRLISQWGWVTKIPHEKYQTDSYYPYREIR